MIKIKIKKKLIKEAALAPYSKEAYNRIFNEINKSFSNGKKHKEIDIDIPLKEIIPIDKQSNKNLKNGLIPFLELHIYRDGNLENVKQFWDPNKKSFEENYLKEYFEKSVVPCLLFISDTEEKFYASANLIPQDDDKILPIVNFNPSQFSDTEDLKRIIIHELTHITQIFIEAGVMFYDLLLKNKNNILNIKPVKGIENILNDKIKTKFGVKQSTGINIHPLPSDEEAQNMTRDEYLDHYIKYISSNIEYKPWLGDIARTYYNLLKNKNLLSKEQHIASLMKQKMIDNPNEKYKIINNFASIKKINSQQATKILNNTKSLQDLASIYTKNLINDTDNIKDDLENSVGGRTFFIGLHMDKRPKEFPKDLTNALYILMKHDKI